MTTQEALVWITGIFEEAPGRLTPRTARADVPGWDSLGILSLIAAFDERFDMHLSEQDIEQMQSVGDILDILRRSGKLAD